LNKTCEDRVGISPTLKGRSVAAWVLDEVRMAASKGYRILEIHKVYEYATTQYDAVSGEGGLFVEYIDTFLKL